MSQNLTLQLSDEAYADICRRAEVAGTSPAQLAAELLERQHSVNGRGDHRTDAEKQAAKERFERHFGSVDLGYPTGLDNESIDAGLALEYADNHEE